MSDLNTTASVTLNVNGAPAKKQLDELIERSNNLKNAIAKAAAAGDKANLTKLRKELKSTENEIKSLQSATQEVENVMKRLDKATPKELQFALQNLKKELNKIERGSEAWVAQMNKIKQVKAEIAKVNMEMTNQLSTWERMNRKFNEWQTAIMGAVAALTGLIMAGRKAVSLYAEMDEQLADTRKYTGMSVEQVEELNESFKKMDTRTSRDQLNLLAQEAGRLGKTTMEDVKGYVEAADIINVALVDLGAGATQTIAKLSNIFRVEEELGTKQAMLSVGSAVNVLSQNCTASKQYLVEFTQRMAGIGAQADLTIPQLLAFGATLDANGQKTEMSASALGKLTMMLFQKPKEIAQQVGLDAEKFTETLQRSTNEGLLMFLERIQQLGSKDGLTVLAPLFKDLGADGVRMSQVLATLAEHLDMVKWEQEEANKAFKEATSASHEYEIFNNTVQAGLDKARKRVQELGIQLGEKLMPIMRHVLSSTTILMRVLNIIVDFFIEHKTAIISATTAFIAYRIAVNASNIALKAHYTWLVIVEKSTKLLKGAVLLSKVAFFALTGQIEKTKTSMAAFNALMKTNPWGLLAAAITAATTALIMYLKTENKISNSEKALNDIRKTASDRMMEEKTKIEMLRNAAMDEKLSKEEQLKAINALNKIIPNYNAHLDSTTGKYVENKKALDDYIGSLMHMYEVEGAKEKLQELGKQKAQAKIDKQQAEKDEEEAKATYEKYKGSSLQTNSFTYGTAGVTMSQMNTLGNKAYRDAEWNMRTAQGRRRVAENTIADIEKQEQAITNVYGTDINKSVVNTPPASSDDDTEGGSYDGNSESDKSKKDKFAQEKEWKSKEEALNRIAYATGQKNFEDYTKCMIEIEQQFYEKELQHKDLTEQEKLELQAKFEEAKKKSSETNNKFTLEEENANYQTSLAMLKQSYVDGKITMEQYEKDAKLLELQHLRDVVNIYQEGSKERLDAQRAYEQAVFEDQKTKNKEQEELEKQHAEKMKKLKEDIFGLNPSERQAAFNEVLGYLNAVKDAELQAAGDNAKEKLRIEKNYQKAKLALMKQYNIEGADENMNFMEKWNEDILDFLDSEVGQSILGGFDVITNGMAAMFSGLSSLIQAETDIQTSAIEAKYDREISLAEGNTAKVKKLEQQKEEETAKIKNEANRKMFAMEVIQAVAQTATSAINAYSSAAAVPVIGYILAPIAAAMAIAAGSIQIAAIKKQQQASAAQGYASGGFTPDGAVDEAVGVVHAGEWVASQKLTKNPQIRPVLEALDTAQRTNTMATIRTEDVSASITAPVESAKNGKIVVSQQKEGATQNNKVLNETIGQLNERLNEPFVTVNTVTGDQGTKKAQDEYERIMHNKSKK